MFAVESPHITADVVEATEFPEWVRKYGVRGVPKTIINDDVEFVGALPEKEFLQYIRIALGTEGTEQIDSE